MDRWLTFALARRLGIAAHMHFPFPRRFLADTLTQLFGAGGFSFDPWEPSTLLWEIMKLLPTLRRNPYLCALHPLSLRPSTRNGAVMNWQLHRNHF